MEPLFNVPAAVLFAQRGLKGDSKDVLDVQTWTGKLPERNARWSTAGKILRMKPGKARVIYLGQRCAWSTEPGATSPTNPSKYQAAFRQGATIVPRSFYFVRIPELDGAVDTDRLYWAETDPEQAAQAKRPYRDVRQSGLIEGRFIFGTALAKHVVPFAVLPPVPVVLPIEERAGLIYTLTSESLIEQGYREFGEWMRQAERTWDEKRAAKSGKQNLYERLDYERELTHQNMRHRHLVLYNHSGMNVAASYFDKKSCPLPFIVDVKTYWAAFSVPVEAHYLVAILNSSFVNQSIKPFQSTGLLGERDIHKKVLDLPIPTYDEGLALHRILGNLGERAGEEAAAAIRDVQFPAYGSLARQRGFVRRRLADTLREIDTAVRKLLGGAQGSKL